MPTPRHRDHERSCTNPICLDFEACDTVALLQPSNNGGGCHIGGGSVQYVVENELWPSRLASCLRPSACDTVIDCPQGSTDDHDYEGLGHGQDWRCYGMHNGEI